MPAKEISDEEFVNEMRILWQGLGVKERNQFGDIIRGFFDCGNRAYAVIFKMQCGINLEKIKPEVPDCPDCQGEINQSDYDVFKCSNCGSEYTAEDLGLNAEDFP